MADSWTDTVIVSPVSSRQVQRRAADQSTPADWGRPIRGRYDAAQTTDNNARHWQWADGLSAKSANDPATRRVLRMRSRYEVSNNCYASGMVETLADDMVGSGPLLQMMTGDEELDNSIEQAFGEWAEAVELASKLHTMRQARAVDGEAFMFLETDPSLGDIQLDLRLYEGDQVATPYFYPPLLPQNVDGIELSPHGKPTAYHLLKQHPGDTLAYTLGFEYDVIPARYVIHWFLHRRPGQYRGVPELTPALGLFAQLRRYGIATLSAAEAAAAFSAVVFTDLPPQNGIQDGNAFDSFDYEHGMFTTLPAGWKMGQFTPSHPTANHEMFKRTTLEEIARTLKVPYNVAAGNSSGYNYASGRLDHQTYYRGIRVDQSRMDREALNRILKEWMIEAASSTRLIRGGLNRPGGWPHRWIWPGIEHVDPVKEANAQQTRMETLTTTFTDECYKDGVDPEHRANTIAKDIERFTRLGLPNPYLKSSPGAAAQPVPKGKMQDQQDGEEDDGQPDDQSDGGGDTTNAFTRRNGYHRS